MRILFTILHCYKPGSDVIHGSARGNKEKRADAVAACIATLHQTYGRQVVHMNDLHRSANGRLNAEVKVVVCTTGNLHALDRVPRNLYEHHPTTANPLLLGYENHVVLAKNIDKFDFYCFLEDDLFLDDPLFFWKLRWFNAQVGPDAALQPNRFEVSPNLSIKKLYLDSRLRDTTLSRRFQDISVQPRLTGKIMGQDVTFERPDNCHSGCFFLDNEQMKRWMSAPYFLDRSDAFAGPIESAGTLGIMRTFRVYKPAAENAGFLEIRHLDNSYLGGMVRPPENLQLSHD